MPFELDPKFKHSGHLREISLGEHKLKIAPLTVRQIIAVSAMLPRLSDDLSTEDRIGVLVDFVLLGLARTYPLTRDELLDCEATIAQLRAATDVVLEQAGGKKVDQAGGTTLGEAEATSDSTGSTGKSSSPSSALN